MKSRAVQVELVWRTFSIVNEITRGDVGNHLVSDEYYEFQDSNFVTTWSKMLRSHAQQFVERDLVVAVSDPDTPHWVLPLLQLVAVWNRDTSAPKKVRLVLLLRCIMSVVFFVVCFRGMAICSTL